MNATSVALEPQIVRPISTPPGMLEAREDMLREAGFTPELVAEAVTVMREAQKATKVTYFAKDGVVLDQREDIDHNTRIRAGEQVLTLANAYPSRSASQAGGKLEVSVVFPQWMQKLQA